MGEAEEDWEALEAVCQAAEEKAVHRTGEAQRSTCTSEQYHHQQTQQQVEARASVQLVHNGKAALNFRGFCPKPIADALRAGGRFQKDAKTSLWLVSICELNVALCEAKKHSEIRNACLHIQQPHSIPQRAMQRGLGTDERYRMQNIAFLESLFPFQRDGVAFALRRGGRALIADEMGCGKTVQALAVCEAFYDEWPILVLVPPIVRDAWQQAAYSWIPMLNSNDVAVIRNKSDRVEGKRLVILPYSRLQAMQERLKQCKFKIVVADESHNLKDGNTKRSKAAKSLIRQARRVLLLSGTPALSRPWELFAQVSMIRPDVFTNYKEYVERYCGNSPFPMKGCSNTEELHGILSWLLMIRRMKRDVLGQLPEKLREQVFLPIEDDDAHGMHKLRQLSKQADEKSSEIDACSESDEKRSSLKREHDQLLTKLYRETAEVKKEPVKNHIKLLLENDTRFLFFAHHRCVLDAAQEALVDAKCKYIRIDGATPSHERERYVYSFEHHEKECAPRVALLSITAAGTGLSFTSCSHVVFGEMTWTPAELQQAEDRVHRIGQNASSIMVQFLHLKDSIDEVLWKTIVHKNENIGQILNGRSEGMSAAAREIPKQKAQNSVEAATIRADEINVKQASTSQKSVGGTIDNFFGSWKTNRSDIKRHTDYKREDEDTRLAQKRKADDTSLRNNSYQKNSFHKTVSKDTEPHINQISKWPMVEGWGADYEPSRYLDADMITENKGFLS